MTTLYLTSFEASFRATGRTTPSRTQDGKVEGKHDPPVLYRPFQHQGIFFAMRASMSAALAQGSHQPRPVVVSAAAALAKRAH